MTRAPTHSTHTHANSSFLRALTRVVVCAFQINFRLPWWQHGSESILRAFNAKLPKDVSAVSLEQVDANFHSRYSASYRRYRYDILNAPHRLPLLSRYTWHVTERLNVAQMQAAADVLVGTHDFSTFGSPPDGEGHCIREIVSISVTSNPVAGAGPAPFAKHSSYISACQPSFYSATAGTNIDVAARKASEPSIVSIDIVGRSFLYHMVRNIVGSLKAVGCGKEDVDHVRSRLLRRSRDACGQPAPAHALTLTQVGFWGEDGGLSFDDWAASRPQEDTGQRLIIGPPKKSKPASARPQSSAP
eukprot:Tamp_15390.p1 GENE.Tamp_15390~~Tamp_15390.p1  ORF type:complete len:302 (+),score=22.90 Tamp_15390:529-1434(+)